MMTCEDKHDQILAYVMGGLDERARAELASHLEDGCLRCRAAVEDAELLAANLSLSVTPIRPPDSSLQRLLERADRERSLKPVKAGQSFSNGRTKRAVGCTESGRSPVFTFRSVLTTSAAVAAIAMLVGSIATYMITASELREHRNELMVMSEKLEQIDSSFRDKSNEANAMRVLVDAAADLFDVLHASALQVVSFHGGSQMPEASGRLFWDIDRNLCHFFASDLEPAEEDMAYRVWLRVDEDVAPIAVGDFNLDDRGSAAFELSLPDGFESVAGITISYAPRDNRDAPGREVLSARVDDFRRHGDNTGF